MNAEREAMSARRRYQGVFVSEESARDGDDSGTSDTVRDHRLQGLWASRRLCRAFMTLDAAR